MNTGRKDDRLETIFLIEAVLKYRPQMEILSVHFYLKFSCIIYCIAKLELVPLDNTLRSISNSFGTSFSLSFVALHAVLSLGVPTSKNEFF